VCYLQITGTGTLYYSNVIRASHFFGKKKFWGIFRGFFKVWVGNPGQERSLAWFVLGRVLIFFDQDSGWFGLCFLKISAD
jgi:hypothetical protein